MDQNKIVFALRAQELATRAAQLMTDLREMNQVWVDRQYAETGINAMVQNDITNTTTPVGTVTTAKVEDVRAVMLFCAEATKFFNGKPITALLNHGEAVNKLRQDM